MNQLIPYIGQEELRFRCQEFFGECLSLLQGKSKDYSAVDDAFANFRMAAEITGMSMEQVIFIYLLKHLSAVENHLRGVQLGEEDLVSKMKDICNYFAIWATLKRLEGSAE